MYKCDIDFNLPFVSPHVRWANFHRYFLEACNEFCKVVQNEELKFWLSTNIQQAFIRPIGHVLLEEKYSAIEISEFSPGSMEDRCIFIDHYCNHEHDETPRQVSKTVVFDVDSLTLHFGHKGYDFEMLIRYEDLDDFIVVDESHLTSCYPMLNRPPHIYRNVSSRTSRRRAICTDAISVNAFGNSSVLRLTIGDYEKSHEVINHIQSVGKNINW